MGQNRALKRALAVVLVVESNTPRRLARAADLRREGFEVYEAANSAEAKAIWMPRWSTSYFRTLT